MPIEEVRDKKGNNIHEGELVFTKLRGSHEGKVGLFLL
jgi:hypothetical protein